MFDTNKNNDLKYQLKKRKNYLTDKKLKLISTRVTVLGATERDAWTPLGGPQSGHQQSPSHLVLHKKQILKKTILYTKTYYNPLLASGRVAESHKAFASLPIMTQID